MSHFDSIFIQGDSHLACEDYALHTVNEPDVDIAVLSDGCSRAQLSDIGSRILCTQAITKKSKLAVLEKKEYQRLVSRSSSIILDLMGFTSMEPIYATLGFISNVHPSKPISNPTNLGISGMLLGDGAFIFKQHGRIIIIKVDYDGNMPYYPAYEIDEQKHTDYNNQVQKFPDGVFSKTVSCYELNINGVLTQTWSHRLDFRSELTIRVEQTERLNGIFYVDLQFDGSITIEIPKPNSDGTEDRSCLEFLFVASDGIFSFFQPKGIKPRLDNDEILRLVMKEIGDILPQEGMFLQRRIRRMVKDLNKNYQLNHSDDISVAGLLF